MSLRAEACLARCPWLMSAPVSAEDNQFVNLGHIFLGLLDVAEGAVALLDLPSGAVSGLSSARMQLSDTLSAQPVRTGPLLMALDGAEEAVQRLLNALCAQEATDSAHLLAEWLGVPR